MIICVLPGKFGKSLEKCLLVSKVFQFMKERNWAPVIKMVCPFEKFSALKLIKRGKKEAKKTKRALQKGYFAPNRFKLVTF